MSLASMKYQRKVCNFSYQSGLFAAMTAPLNFSASSSSKSNSKDKPNIFALGERKDTLVNIDSPIIICHVAEERQQKYPFENLFKSLCRLVIDNAASEAVFVREFFVLQSQDAVDLVFNEIFDSSMKYILVLRTFNDSKL